MTLKELKQIFIPWDLSKMRKIVVVGLGNIATRHRRNLRQLYPQAVIYALSASERVVDDLVSDCDGYLPDIAAVVDEGVDMAIVASPSSFHLRHSQQLIEAGIPTLIEKPVTATAEEAAELMEIASKYDTPLAVGYCLRYLPSARILKDMLANEDVGVVYNVNIDIGQYLPDWRPSKSYKESVSASKKLGGGALLELSHELDYAQWLFGELDLISSVLRSSDELEMDVESIADIMAANSKGSIVNIHLDFLQKKPWRQCHIIGSKGRVVWDLIRNEVLFYSGEDTRIIYSDPEWNKNGMYLDMLKDFAEKISRHKNQCVSLESSVKIVGLIDKIKNVSQFYGTK